MSNNNVLELYLNLALAIKGCLLDCLDWLPKRGACIDACFDWWRTRLFI